MHNLLVALPSQPRIALHCIASHIAPAAAVQHGSPAVGESLLVVCEPITSAPPILSGVEPCPTNTVNNSQQQGGPSSPLVLLQQTVMHSHA
jgi:hypothetical protein